MKNIINNIILCVLILQTSITAFANPTTSSSISEDLRKWNNAKKIPLLEHQLKPIDYLEKNDDIKGLLVYHYLGTGKTFLSLGLAERYPYKDVLILVPNFLVSHWKKNIDLYGVTNPKRYKIVTHDEPKYAILKDLSNSIVIIDESHRLINKLSSSDPKTSDTYSDLYLNLRNSYKMLSLTGTPIYSDTMDAAYQINLVSGKDLLPFNRLKFRKDLTLINQNKSFIRGHLIESQMATHLFMIGGLALTPLLAPVMTPLTISMFPVVTSMIPFAVKQLWKVDENSMRIFNVEKLAPFTEKYVTYYNFDKIQTKDYPSKTIYYKDVSYNDFQMNFLMRFADNSLTTKEIIVLQKDEVNRPNSRYIELNNSKIQEMMKQRPIAGLEIGNLTFKDKSGNNIHPQKFAKALKTMVSTDKPVVVYSHFYNNGLLLFKRYLDKMGHKGHYRILDPNLPSDEYEKVISDYNDGKVKFLLIHPDITEGISLKGTAQLHMLEPSVNKSAQEQIIGRAVRYMSHSHLPIQQRHVDVYIWQQTLSGFDLEHSKMLRRNWSENFSEMNYYSERAVIDKNASLKISSPDDRAYHTMNVLDFNTKSLIELIKQLSIEKHYK